MSFAWLCHLVVHRPLLICSMVVLMFVRYPGRIPDAGPDPQGEVSRGIGGRPSGGGNRDTVMHRRQRRTPVYPSKFGLPGCSASSELLISASRALHILERVFVER